MKVLLRTDIPGLGKKGDIKEVSEGYARNALLPTGSVVAASSANVKEAEQAKKGQENRAQKAKRAAGRAARSVDGAVLEFTEPATDSGRLYAALSSERIADEVEKGFGVRPDSVRSKEPIKTSGAHSVDLGFSGARARITCVVRSEAS